MDSGSSMLRVGCKEEQTVITCIGNSTAGPAGGKMEKMREACDDRNKDRREGKI